MAARGFDISPEVKRKVDEKIREYFALQKKIEEGIDDEDYFFLPSFGYDQIMTSKTNAISKTVELQAIKISEKREELDMAQSIVGAIDRGISRAAKTCSRIDLREELREHLFENLVVRTPRHLFSRSPHTFAKYRRRAYYYIAEELHFLEN